MRQNGEIFVFFFPLSLLFCQIFLFRHDDSVIKSVLVSPLLSSLLLHMLSRVSSVALRRSASVCSRVVSISSSRVLLAPFATSMLSSLRQLRNVKQLQQRVCVCPILLSYPRSHLRPIDSESTQQPRFLFNWLGFATMHNVLASPDFDGDITNTKAKAKTKSKTKSKD